MRFGVIGTNFITDRFLAALPHAGGECAAVLSRTRERGEEYAEKQNIPLVFDTADEFFASDAFEAVYIATPNYAHASQAVAALRAGKHVLCEKPAAPTKGEWESMKQAACAAGRTLMEAMRPVHDRTWQNIRAFLPRLGQIRLVHLDYCQYSSRYDRFRAGEILNAFDPALGNAALLDIGVYPLAVCVWLFGAPKKIQSRSSFLKNGFEGCGEVSLDYGDFGAVITYSKVADSAAPSVITGENGSIVIDKVSYPQSVTFRPRGGKEEVIPFCPPDAPDNMDAEIRDFTRAAEGEEISPLWEVTDREMDVIDEVCRQNNIRFV